MAGRYVIVQMNSKPCLNFQEVKAFGRVAIGEPSAETTDSAIGTATCEQNESLLLGLFSVIGVLSLLLILQTVAVAVFIYKRKSSARKVIKKDINPIYGVEYDN